jgi:hypothetical protein
MEKKASSSAPLSNRYEHQIPCFFPHATTQRPLLALPLVISTHTEYFFTTPTLHQHFSSRIARNEFKTQLVRLQDKAARTCPPLTYRARIGRTPLLLPFALPYSIYPSTTATTYHHPKLMPKKRRILMTYKKPLRSPPRVLTHSTPTIVDTYTHAPSSPASLRPPSLFAGTDSHSTAHSLSIAATHKGTSSAAPRPTLPFGTTGISSAFGLHLPSVQHHTDTNILQYQLERPASPTHALRCGPSRSLPFPPSIHAGRSCRHGITLRDVCSEHHHQTANVQRERNLLSMGVVSSCPSSFFPGAHCASPFV